MTPRPLVDVVVLTWNDGELLGAAVDSALASEGVEVRVHVIDNGSEPRATVRPDPRVTLARNDANRGVAPARNQGAAAGRAPYILFLDSDARLRPGTLGALVGPLEASSAVALTAPVFAGQAPEQSAGRAPSLADKARRLLDLRSDYRPMRPADRGPGTADAGSSWEVDFAIGACQLVRRVAFDALGGFDESYFYGPEDVDLCLRLRESGFRVVQVGAAECEHPPRRRNRRLATKRGVQHASAVVRHLWRHRRFHRRVAA